MIIVNISFKPDYSKSIEHQCTETLPIFQLQKKYYSTRICWEKKLSSSENIKWFPQAHGTRLRIILLYFVPIVGVADAISDKWTWHFYLEVSNSFNRRFQLKRRHNEYQVIIWDGIEYAESLLDNGVLEKYVQTD